MKKRGIFIAAMAASLVFGGITASASYDFACIVLLHSEIDGEVCIDREEDREYTATAVLPDEKTAVDHWEIDGVDTGEDGEAFTFSGSDGSVVSAVLRPRKIVTGINCHLQFFDKNEKPAGEAYEEIDFEEEYRNPVTGEAHEGGMICVQVTADVPAGYEVDYWLINDVEYDFDAYVESFGVHGLDEKTVYEVVFRKSEQAKKEVKKTETELQETETPDTNRRDGDTDETNPPETEPPRRPTETETDRREDTEETEPGHIHVQEPCDYSNPYCETPGFAYYECGCGAYWKVEIAPPLGHDMQPVYNEEGTEVIYLKCSRCGTEVG